jgi:hypothetical protein
MTCCIARSTATYYANINSFPGRNIGDGHLGLNPINEICERKWRTILHQSWLARARGVFLPRARYVRERM